MAVPEQSLERRSTPTQERETVATAGVGPRRGRGGGERERDSFAPVSPRVRGAKPYDSSSPTAQLAGHASPLPTPPGPRGRSQTPPHSPS